jgi:hypothetical protein
MGLRGAEANSIAPPVSKPSFCHDVQNDDKGVLVIAVLIEDVFPVGITIELLDAVTDEMGVDAQLPPGGIVHVHFGWPCSRPRRVGLCRGLRAVRPVNAHASHGQGCRGKRPRPVKHGRTRSDDHRGPSPPSLSDDTGTNPQS